MKTGMSLQNRAKKNPLPHQSSSPGKRHAGDGGQVHGGGGPENLGARSSTSVMIPARQEQPSWCYETGTFSEYLGCAAPSTKPDLSGIPSNNARGLGDLHGGRQ